MKPVRAPIPERPASPAGAAREPAAGRDPSLDVVRGAVMVLMALDHVRFFFTDAQFPPEDMSRTTLPLFLTRWVTHFCAPAFFFLAGASAFLWARRGCRSASELSLFLATRGAWLVALELTVIGFAWSFRPGHSFAGVIWALGWSMIALAALSRLPLPALAAGAAATIALHGLLDRIDPASLGAAAWLAPFIRGHGMATLPGLDVPYLVLYSLVPWVAVMTAGFAAGPLFALPAHRRRRLLVAAGLAMTAAFLVLRATNAYGEPAVPSTPGAQGHFAAYPTARLTLVALLNVEKYPASLLFLLMTLGPTLVALGLLAGRGGAVRGPLGILVTFGRVPMFYYVLHLFVIHGLAAAAGYRQVGLASVYAITALVAALLYLPCRWFAGVKQRRRDWWLSYL